MLLEAGLARRARRRHGRSRGSAARLLFPIHDLRGRVGRASAAGCSGRASPSISTRPRRPIFHKGTLLYNLHQAKGAIRKEESVILVEGYFDVLRLVLAGIEHVVAPLGTALTSEQAALLRRFAPAADPALRQRPGRPPRHLPRRRRAAAPRGAGAGGDDAAGRGSRHAGARRAARRRSSRSCDDAMDVLERKIQLLERKGWFEGVDHRREALDRLLPTIRAAADPITRDLYLKEVSERTGVSREVLREQAARAASVARRRLRRRRARGLAGAREGRSAPVARRRAQDGSAERDLLRVLMRDPRGCARAASEVPAEWFETPALREVFEALSRQSRKRRPGHIPGAAVGRRPAGVGLARQHRAQVRRAGSGSSPTCVPAGRSKSGRCGASSRRSCASNREPAAVDIEEYDDLDPRTQPARHREISSRYPEELLKRIRDGEGASMHADLVKLLDLQAKDTAVAEVGRAMEALTPRSTGLGPGDPGSARETSSSGPPGGGRRRPAPGRAGGQGRELSAAPGPPAAAAGARAEPEGGRRR